MTDFQQIIKSWYLANKRDLPWRETKNPYKIWLSEIILQQTRVAQGLSYYEKFIRHYPTVRDLAAASEQEVLADWQGLGYYSRARNLHATAKQIATDFDAVFPTDYKSILKLKGIGEYTASAIASFAYDLPHAVVDGNVYRVLSRLFDIDLP
ncbi:MAG: A/G-specific adenine glycosylase, partial [Crocinitomicaceae bacterium]|nr:A/G-specific adenine glycosylase [Crocinitomicaceae bacterium]